MKKKQEYLQKLLELHAKRALNEDLTEDERNESFRKVMAISDKIKDNDKLDKHDVIKLIEIGGSVLLVPVIDYFVKRSFVRDVCKAEQFESFTTTAGRTIGQIFRFKR